jgi:Transport protein particle (TRAPP) component
MPDVLDKMKFLCKDFWIKIYMKSIDNLKTNHRGVYLLEDFLFKPFLKLALPTTKDMPALVGALEEEIATNAIPVETLKKKFKNAHSLVFGISLWSAQRRFAFNGFKGKCLC